MYFVTAPCIGHKEGDHDNDKPTEKKLQSRGSMPKESFVGGHVP